jgi:ribonuclease HII
MPDFSLEDHYPNLPHICGVDEAGRGPWAGPVIASALIFTSRNTIPEGIHDSKKIPAPKRERLFDALQSCAIIGTGIASVEEIDALNIWGATALAMRRAVMALGVVPDLALIDGNRIPAELPCKAQAIIRGDGASLSIAAASIIAKVTRDRVMKELDGQFPQYGFSSHQGYGTMAHHNALKMHGPCSAHRKSFAPIRALLKQERAA